ncbi:MAG: hypothetical protein EOO74_03210 [Myxococcales bacterium]|nr:MAG: hypothetical protein EOO74_03210 [Myxococcales bacterium]
MTLGSTLLSDSLHRSLALCHDPRQPPLVVRSRGADLEVTRASGAEPSASEQREVRARLAAHVSDADDTPTVRLRMTRVGDELVMTVLE